MGGVREKEAEGEGEEWEGNGRSERGGYGREGEEVTAL